MSEKLNESIDTLNTTIESFGNSIAQLPGNIAKQNVSELERVLNTITNNVSTALNQSKLVDTIGKLSSAIEAGKPETNEKDKSDESKEEETLQKQILAAILSGNELTQKQLDEQQKIKEIESKFAEKIEKLNETLEQSKQALRETDYSEEVSTVKGKYSPFKFSKAKNKGILGGIPGFAEGWDNLIKEKEKNEISKIENKYPEVAKIRENEKEIKALERQKNSEIKEALNVLPKQQEIPSLAVQAKVSEVEQKAGEQRLQDALNEEKTKKDDRQLELLPNSSLDNVVITPELEEKNRDAVAKQQQQIVNIIEAAKQKQNESVGTSDKNKNPESGAESEITIVDIKPDAIEKLAEKIGEKLADAINSNNLQEREEQAELAASGIEGLNENEITTEKLTNNSNPPVEQSQPIGPVLPQIKEGFERIEMSNGQVRYREVESKKFVSIEEATIAGTVFRENVNADTLIEPGGEGIPKKAEGGEVYNGEPVVVGEQGPELFIPENKGQIITNENFKSSTESQTNIIKGISAIQKTASSLQTNLNNTTSNLNKIQGDVLANTSSVLENISNTATQIQDNSSSELLKNMCMSLHDISEKLDINNNQNNSGNSNAINSNSTSSSNSTTFNITTTGNPITNSRLRTDSMMNFRRSIN